jgi:hypothetical protein
MSEKEAFGAARRRFGNPTSIREQICEFNSFAFLDAVGRDLRYALRGLSQNPALSLTIVLTIAIGVGTVTSMFALMQDLLLAPPPHVGAPDRAFRVYHLFPKERQEKSTVNSRTTYQFYELLANRAESLEAAAACTNDDGLAAGSGPQARATRAIWTRRFLTETSALALLGAIAAVFAVALGEAWLHRVVLPTMAWEPPRVVDPCIFAVAAVCIAGAAFAAGMAPLLYARSGIMSAIHDESLRGPSKRPRMQTALLAMQGALSLVLLVGAGLFVRSLHNAQTVDIGLDRSNVFAVQIDFSGTGPTGADEAVFFERALEHVSAMPGVARASLASSTPLRLALAGVFGLCGGKQRPELPDRIAPMVNGVTPGFFATTGMRILEYERRRRSGDHAPEFAAACPGSVGVSPAC